MKKNMFAVPLLVVAVFAMVFVMTGVLGGCAVGLNPDGRMSFGFQPLVLPPVVVAEEMDYIGESTPVIIEAYPGVPFYPRYVEGCDCIWTVGFVGGFWINDSGMRVVHEGGWHHPPSHIAAAHREMMRRNPNMYHRANAPARRQQHQQTQPQQHQQHQQQAGPQQQHQQHQPQQQQVQPQQHQQQQQRAPAPRAPVCKNGKCY